MPSVSMRRLTEGRVMRWQRAAYTALHWLVMPVVAVRLVYRASGNRAYLKHLRERVGLVTRSDNGERPLWLHAVSVGEVQASVPIVRELKAAHPHLPVLVTVTTPTGRQRVTQAMPDGVSLCYIPYDLPPFMKRFLDTIRPRVLVVMETELWPNLLAMCAARDIPVVLANARMSARSANGYRRFFSLSRDMLRSLSGLAVQSQADATRLLSLGAPMERVVITGSVKFDAPVPASLREQGQVLRRYWGARRSVLLAASTHDGEDQEVLAAYRIVLMQIPDCLLVLVPRHPERFQSVAALARRQGYATVTRSNAPAVIEGIDVFVGDTMGELPLFYAAADVAFVGGSLVPIGGHNVLEPAALGIPVLVGPHTFNFSEITRLLISEGACFRVQDATRLAERAVALLMDGNLRHNTGQKGAQVVARNRGALIRVVSMIQEQLRQTDGTG